MTRRPSPKLAGFASVAAIFLVGALATGRPELVVMAAPFAVILVTGLLTAQPPVWTTLSLDVEPDRLIEGEAITLDVRIAAETDVERVEVVLPLPSGGGGRVRGTPHPPQQTPPPRPPPPPGGGGGWGGGGPRHTNHRNAPTALAAASPLVRRTRRATGSPRRSRRASRCARPTITAVSSLRRRLRVNRGRSTAVRFSTSTRSSRLSNTARNSVDAATPRKASTDTPGR